MATYGQRMAEYRKQPRALTLSPAQLATLNPLPEPMFRSANRNQAFESS